MPDEQPDQETLQVDAGEPMFMTDETVAQELRSIANGLHDLAAHIPSLGRRLEAVARQFRARDD